MDKWQKFSLCKDCKYKKEIRSKRGSTFWLCMKSREDANFPKYRGQPVVKCKGYQKEA